MMLCVEKFFQIFINYFGYDVIDIGFVCKKCDVCNIDLKCSWQFKEFLMFDKKGVVRNVISMYVQILKLIIIIELYVEKLVFNVEFYVEFFFIV